MEMIDQLRDGKTKAFAKHCFERYSPEELNAASEGVPDQDEMAHWEITAGQWEEAIAAALADHHSQG
ncbi:hypothetical protein FF32_15550 [Halomonas campaniensis]|uniref:Uncharacterized protein n=1 Tax=Vreelandella alkaliphila TaxID=272774 RepID=A0AAJ2RQ06_9GAMM|nr:MULTISPECIES: hypothetical protein [Halomonas]AIA76200.1 hypothetical protein FF32_15550 [Halomonas campaniensis]MCD6003398.1 hypothetical protein [Halomonas sp. IOP_6]MCD6436723.1 hypothetical protein [Halomonas sp.]MDX5976143.1 hypothetical protein [Halomonas alkaliphila]